MLNSPSGRRLAEYTIPKAPEPIWETSLYGTPLIGIILRGINIDLIA